MHGGHIVKRGSFQELEEYLGPADVVDTTVDNLVEVEDLSSNVPHSDTITIRYQTPNPNNQNVSPALKIQKIYFILSNPTSKSKQIEHEHGLGLGYGTFSPTTTDKQTLQSFDWKLYISCT
jgi:hypothetical protein